MLTINNLKESNTFLSILIDNLVSAVFIVDKDIRIQSFNESFQALFHKQQDKILGELCGNAIGCEFAVVEDKACGTTSNCNGCPLRESLLKAFSEKIPAYKEKISRNFYIDGRLYKKFFQYSARYVFFNNEDLVLIIVDDITELMDANMKLKKMAITDGLTGLYNHKHIFYRFEEEIKKAERYKTACSVIMLDIDHFKTINDTFGHHIGDQVLAEVSRVIKKSTRAVDIPGRYGGEEFIIILPQTSLNDAYRTAERIRKNIESIVFKQTKLTVTISGGVSEFREESPLQLIERVDQCLYQAKKNGRNRIEKA